MARVVLAYSGGPSSSAAIPWLKEKHRAEVIAVIVDLGQREALDSVRQRAIASGAVRAHVLDWRERFVREHVLPLLHRGRLPGPGAAVADAAGWPLVARAVADVAAIEGASTVAHAEDDPEAAAALDAAIASLNPKLRVIDCAREWSLDPDALAAYTRARGIPRNSGELPGAARLVIAPSPAEVAVEFAAGVPVRVNGVEMELVELVTSVETIAAPHRVDGLAVLAAASQALQEHGQPSAATGAVRVRVHNGSCEVVSVQ